MQTYTESIICHLLKTACFWVDEKRLQLEFEVLLLSISSTRLQFYFHSGQNVAHHFHYLSFRFDHCLLAYK